MKSKLLKKLLLFAGMLTTFSVGYGVVAQAYPSGGVYGRGEHRGYFVNTYDNWGTYVLPATYSGNAIPSDINNATELINFIKGSNGLASSNNQRRTGAAFIIQTMIGTARNRPPTAAQIAEWESRVRDAANEGRINWYFNYSYNINSYFQGTGSGSNPNDDAFYDDAGTATTIVFTNSSGTITYGIRRQCANPVGRGNISWIEDSPNFTMTGRTTVNNATPLPGETIQFRHYLRNSGPGATAPTNIWWITQNMPSQATTGGAASSGTYTSGQEKNVHNENVTIPSTATPGTQYCRRVGWDPVNGTGTRNGRGATVCATVRYDFNLTPLINVEVNGETPPGSVAEEGDEIEFSYFVHNGGATPSRPTNCNIYGLVRNGSYTAPTPADQTSDPGYIPPATGCPRVFPDGTTTDLVTETITATTGNRTICRSLWLNPATHTGGTVGTERCIRIAAKPYLKVYGGDVAAGGGLESAPETCTNNNNGAIISWNRGTSFNYAGAGAQYAAYALSSITDFGTGRGNSVGGTTPSWLSFANSVNVNNPIGQFGGMFGSASCITDYYAQLPGSTSAIPGNVSSMTSGAYGGNGTITLAGGNVNPGENISVFVNGNLYITSNITYPGSWNYENIPLLQVVVRGNIYISGSVTRLDGVFIAQRNGASGGTIYTCASGASAPILTNGAFFNACSNKLTINGAFVANSVEFLRTAGSLSQSTSSESSAASAAGEVFNFNPALWMTQPLQSSDSQNNYDAITSLPPVL
jgi:hypothetical protein